LQRHIDTLVDDAAQWQTLIADDILWELAYAPSVGHPARLSGREEVVVCGALLIIGLLTRVAAAVLLIDISIAIISTKIPVLVGHGFWRFSLMKLPRYGFWSMMHEARTDFSMWLGLLFLLIVGAGKWSFDAAVWGCAKAEKS
jgi:uncharacterized membrane protein YphA (DoxX/SURF4 family)